MTLFGLDLIVNQEGKPFLGEINGICSGMGGFRQVYGDTRVEDKVYQMLSERYGVLSVNDGTYQVEKFKREHPLQYHWKKVIRQNPDLWHFLNPAPSAWYSEKALLHWTLEKVPEEKILSFPFEVYRGQDSTVIDTINEKNLPSPSLNPYVAEEITKNKFLQYLVLQKTPLCHVLPATTLVGLGYVYDQELNRLMESHDLFVQKPLLGKCGKGVKIYDQKEAQDFIHLSGPIHNESLANLMCYILFSWKTKPTFLEDLMAKDDFSFEKAVGIIQPFIDSAREIDGQECYSSIRAIVCNGKFVDAYERYSPEKRVNLSQGAKARAFERDGLAEFCEYVTATFERECAALHPDTFKQQLYSAYLDNGGRRHWRENFFLALSGAVISSMEFTVKR